MKLTIHEQSSSFCLTLIPETVPEASLVARMALQGEGIYTYASDNMTCYVTVPRLSPSFRTTEIRKPKRR